MKHAHSASPTNMQRRRDVRNKTSCPKCGAETGQKCFAMRRSGAIYIRARSHQERWGAAREMKGECNAP